MEALTTPPQGVTQSSSLLPSHPSLATTTAVILTSPLTRAIETTLAAFGPILPDVKLILDPDLQERSALPCDTGSPIPDLISRFPALEGEIKAGITEEGEWFAKEGKFAEDDEAVKARAARVRGRLAGLVKGLEGERQDVVVVTHGVFMKFLAEDEGVDLPKAGWKGYRVVGEGEGARLVAV